jgi:predicted glutamine amidotransferase
MCGIFGFTSRDNSSLSSGQIIRLIKRLYLGSESRGQDASGLAYLDYLSSQIKVYKRSLPAHCLIKNPTFRQELHSWVTQPTSPLVFIGHSRMETNGSYSLDNNNQPIIKDNIVSIHNGIIVNDSEIWHQYPRLQRQFQVDTEVVNSHLRFSLSQGHTITSALYQLYQDLEGSISLSSLFADYQCQILTTNTGSLYYLLSPNYLVFSSERHILVSALDYARISVEKSHIKQLPPGFSLIIDIPEFKVSRFNHSRESTPCPTISPSNFTITQIDPVTHHLTPPVSHLTRLKKLVESEYHQNLPQIKSIRRCSRCILPETMPFIKFDSQGVCNYCLNYHPHHVKGEKQLSDLIKPYLHRPGPNCIVPFSGGRDSSFGLHYVKKNLGLTPLAFSYDWGMLTDLGRRNQARMLGRLGIEHILVSADIHQKRHFIHKNVSAWLAKPDLGTIPLFMAGDKQYFYYINRLRQQTGIDLIIYSENFLEKTDFKSGFCGVKPKLTLSDNDHLYKLGFTNKLILANYYLKHYLTNPHLLNSSIIDTFTAYLSSYFIPHDYLYLFNYLPWNENTINRTLTQDYHWETSPDTPTTWRIGDGTAAFYNYIYYTVAGFTENDTFRSNQIREGLLDRDTALQLSQRDNQPRLESLEWYFTTINIDPLQALRSVHQIKKLYQLSK